MRTAVYLAVMLVLGLAALAVPGWLHDFRDRQPLTPPARASALPPSAGGGPRQPLETLVAGLRDTLTVAEQALDAGEQTRAARAMDAARRAADVGAHASGEALKPVLGSIQRARKQLQDGRNTEARRTLAQAGEALQSAAPALAPARPPSAPGEYVGGTLINARGERIGEVVAASGGELELVLGGGRDFMGLFDVGGGPHVRLPVDALVFGPDRFLGATLVAAPSFQKSPDALARELGARP